MLKQAEYIDDIPISAAVLADIGMYFVGLNANLQRGEFVAGPWGTLQEDPTHWLDINVRLSQQGVWNDVEGVPIMVLRPQRIQAAWLWSRVAWGHTGLMRAVVGRDLYTDYGLAVYLRGEDLTQGLPAGSQILHIRGRYERV